MKLGINFAIALFGIGLMLAAQLGAATAATAHLTRYELAREMFFGFGLLIGLAGVLRVCWQLGGERRG